MERAAAVVMAVALAAGSAGCCAGPGRFYQNAYGFENPNIERYAPGPPPPVTTPPGYTTPASAALPAEDVVGSFPGEPGYPNEPEEPVLEPIPQP